MDSDFVTFAQRTVTVLGISSRELSPQSTLESFKFDRPRVPFALLRFNREL